MEDVGRAGWSHSQASCWLETDLDSWGSVGVGSGGGGEEGGYWECVRRIGGV